VRITNSPINPGAEHHQPGQQQQAPASISGPCSAMMSIFVKSFSTKQKPRINEPELVPIRPIVSGRKNAWAA